MLVQFVAQPGANILLCRRIGFSYSADRRAAKCHELLLRRHRLEVPQVGDPAVASSEKLLNSELAKRNQVTEVDAMSEITPSA